MNPTPTMLRHNKIDLALWQLAEGEGRPLLLLHGLGERTQASSIPAGEWDGPIYGLDFTGHGASSIAAGGGYFCEVLMGDADMALRELGSATVVGRGLGGYIALLIAGARPTQVRGAVILDGPGLSGGGPTPTTLNLYRAPQDGTTPDSMAITELSQDIRPPDYARSFAWQAAMLSGLDSPIVISGVNRPAWLAQVADQPGVIQAPVADALTWFAAVD